LEQLSGLGSAEWELGGGLRLELIGRCGTDN
jgi:hypothetical protein